MLEEEVRNYQPIGRAERGSGWPRWPKELGVSTLRKLYNPGAKAMDDTFQYIMADMTTEADTRYACKICPSKQTMSSEYARH